MTLLALTGLLSLPVVSLGAQTQMGTEQEDEALNGSASSEFSTGEMDEQMAPQADIRDPFDPRSFSVTPEREADEGEQGRIERIMGRSPEDERREMGSQEGFRKSEPMPGKEQTGEMDEQMPPQAKIRDPFEPRSFSVTPEKEAEEGEHGRIERIMGRSMEDEKRETGTQDRFRKSETMPKEQAGEMRREGAAGDTGAQGSFRRSEDMTREQDRSFRESEKMDQEQERGTLSRPTEPRGMEGEASGDVGAQGSFRSDTRQEEGRDATSGSAGTTGRMEGAEGTHGGTQSAPGTTQRSPGASGSFGGSAGGSMGGSVGGSMGGSAGGR
jgi:hypothetical protein